MHLIPHQHYPQIQSQSHIIPQQNHSHSHQPHSISTPTHQIHPVQSVPALSSGHRDYVYPHSSYPTNVYYANSVHHQQQVAPMSYVIVHSQDSVNRYQMSNSNRYETKSGNQQNIAKTNNPTQPTIGILNQYETAGQQQLQQYQVT